MKYFIFSLVFLSCIAGVARADDDPVMDAMRAEQSGDYQKAFELARPLADKGDPDAEFVMGGLYSGGRGVNMDWQAAAFWYRSAAEQGHKISQELVGALYENGRGVKQDFAEAYFWYSLSGREYAQKQLPAVQKNLTPEQKAALDKRVAEWKPMPVKAQVQAPKK